MDLAKERIILAAEVKKVLKLKIDVAELQKTITELHNIHQTKIKRLHSIHQAKIESKDTLCESDKVRVLKEQHVSYNVKLSGLYAKQCEYAYWPGYDEVERIACGDPEPSSKDATTPTRNTYIAKPIGSRPKGIFKGKIFRTYNGGQHRA